MEIKIIRSFQEISSLQWQDLTGNYCPFERFEFLSALEQTGCVGQSLGWLSTHFTIFESDRLVAAMPAYLKTNSYGELVFDWAWADAYQRAGLAYYPKLVTAIPYTPATGRRLLVLPGENEALYKSTLIEAARVFVQENRFSSYHCLFPNEEDLGVLREQGLLLRQACQFHWYNRGYTDFSEFLATFASRKRKNVLRERKQVQQAGIEIRRIPGSELGHEDWQQLYPFYRDTFLQKGGMPTLTQAFFEQVSRTMGEQLMVAAALSEGEYVAAAIFFHGQDTLYGRHWGCKQRFSGLHFELCYYQGIEFAIERGLQRFEPGAQGEYKISRGFEPSTTWSAHWIADVGFRRVIDDFLQRETAYMHDYCEALKEDLPFRKDNQ